MPREAEAQNSIGLPANREGLAPDPLWYKSGVIYELHVRAFFDADGNGTGDFRGLTEKLDYLKDLGVTALWLLPFYPSPLKDDGYDIADYCNVHPMYGTLRDFRVFLREAHRRGLRVITELVLNHTSADHPWFQRARRAKPGSRWRNFYVWSDSGHEYKDARVIFKDVELSNWTWDHVAKAYYWHRFFSHQPDLNYENPEVHEQMTRVMDFWLDLGVDGLRLDAVPYLYEREGTNCENLPETHAFLKRLRTHTDAKYRDRMLLAEANQWPEDAVAYFGQEPGDECHMAFHFPLMPRLFMAVRMEDSLPIVSILEQTPPIPSTSQWALFLRNHDELTLEMVTDEERDYMYRMYAQTHQARLNLGIRRRLAPLMGNDRRRIELLNALLFSLPGTPVLYYGDEIGMGENIYLGDRNGVRTPMHWSSDKNAGFSPANPQSLYLPIILDPQGHYEAVNVEAQLANPHSLLWWMRRLLSLRKRWRALGEGKCEFLRPNNHRILSYILRFEQEIILVVANLSRFVQPVELDLASFAALVPIELFGRMKFPPITKQPYFLTLGPHAFYWFSLEADSRSLPGANECSRLPQIRLQRDWQEIFGGKPREALESLLPKHLESQSWFSGAPGTLRLATCKEVLQVPLDAGQEAALALVEADYLEREGELLSLPLAFASTEAAARVREQSPRPMLAELTLAVAGEHGLLYDGMASESLCRSLLEAIASHRPLKGLTGYTEAIRTPELREILHQNPDLPVVSLKGQHSNSAVLFGEKLVLKLLRRIESGVHPELEVGRFLQAQHFPYCARFLGALTYEVPEQGSTLLALVTECLAHAIPAWDYTLDALSRYYDRAITWVAQGKPAPSAHGDAVALMQESLPQSVAEDIGTFLESARLLGLRTAQLHLALASDPETAEFAPETLTPNDQRALLQTLRNLATQTLRSLRQHLSALPASAQNSAQRVLDAQPAILQCYREAFQTSINARRIRTHGHCHLGQVLWTGKDFAFIDFGGEPGVPFGERRIKRSPLRDVAALLCSLQFAARTGLRRHAQRGSIPDENLAKFEPWVTLWSTWTGVAFLRAYFDGLGTSVLLPQNQLQLRRLLQAYCLDQMLSELGRHWPARPDRVEISLQAILRALGEQAPPPAPL